MQYVYSTKASSPEPIKILQINKNREKFPKKNQPETWTGAMQTRLLKWQEAHDTCLLTSHQERQIETSV